MFGIDDAIAAGLKILDKFIPDQEAKAKAETELRDSLMKWDQGQMQVNATEAAHDSLFVAGWRPAIGWICAFALLYSYILIPFTIYVFSFVLEKPIPKFPVLDGNLWELMFGMLGMGGLRTYEKFKGVSK
jgi:hypothetical protein